MGQIKEKIEYKNLKILAPMVKICSLPFRLECLKYGADLVYSEEIVDKKIIKCTRIINESTDTIDYRSTDGDCLVFSTNKNEKGKLIFQLGTSDSGYAIKAVDKIINDVDGIDINMGCPKKFSTKGGMGSALLKKPEIASDIIKVIKRNYNCNLTCKIRLLSTTEETIDFCRCCEHSGISAIALHSRDVNERPNHRAHWEIFPILKSILSVPLIANGDIFSQNDINFFQKNPNLADSIMIARGAMWNPAIFNTSSYEQTDKVDVLRSFFSECLKFNLPYHDTKFALQKMVSQESSQLKDIKNGICASKSINDLKKAIIYSK